MIGWRLIRVVGLVPLYDAEFRFTAFSFGLLVAMCRARWSAAHLPSRQQITPPVRREEVKERHDADKNKRNNERSRVTHDADHD